MINHAVIVAIGDPQHRSQLTYNRIHAMLPALGKPMVVRMMDRLHRIGIRKYTVIVGVNEGPVASYLNEQWMPDVEIDLKYKSDHKSLASLFRDIASEQDEAFIYCNYNTFTHPRFSHALLKHHDDHPQALTIGGSNSTLSVNPGQHYALMNGHKIKRIIDYSPVDQPYLHLADFAICGTKMREFLAELPAEHTSDLRLRFLNLADLFIKAGGEAYVTETSWMLQIENDRDLITLNKHLLDEGQDAHILSELPYTVQIIPPVRIDPQVSVGQGAVIGPYVYLERGCSVGRDVKIRNAVILQRAAVPAEKTVADTIISTRGPIQ